MSDSLPTTPSTVRRTDVPNAVLTEQGYVAAWNMEANETPVNTTIKSTQAIILPVTVTLPGNGMQPIIAAGSTASNWNWMRMTVACPSTMNSPLIIDAFLLKGNESEPPVTIDSQYIRVVIRNYTIPTGEKP